MKTLTLKIPEALNDELERAIARTRLTRSELIRAAIADYLGRRRKAKPSAFDLISDLVGSLRGPGDLSTNKRHLEGYGE